MRGLLILAALVAWKLYQDSQGETVLGSRVLTAMEDFKNALTPVANKVEAETGISARLGVYQSALESAYGTSQLSRTDAKLNILPGSGRVGPANNLFGFKCGEAWMKAGRPYVLVPTTDYYKRGQKMPNGKLAVADGQALQWPAPFRAYGSWEESYRDWARLMATDMYVKDGAYDALKNDDLEKFGKALSIHYAPNQNYAARLQERANAMGEIA